MQGVDPFRTMTDCDKQYSSFIIFYSVLKKIIYVRHPVLLAGVQGYLANGMHIETSGFKNNPVTEHESSDSDRKKKPLQPSTIKKTSRVALFERQRENIVIQTSILTVDAEHEITHDKPKNRFEFFYDRWKMLFRRAKL